MGYQNRNPRPLGASPASRERRAPIGYLLAATGAILFSIKAVIVKLAYGLHVDPETLLALRMGFSLPFYLGIGFLAVQGRRHKLAALPSMGRTIRAALIGTLGMWVASYTDFLGLQYISAQFERLILLTYPIFVVLFGAMFFRQTVRPPLIAQCASLCGAGAHFRQRIDGGRMPPSGGLSVAAISTTGPHPMKLLRQHLPNIWRATDLASARHGATVQIAGNVICRQRPGTAKGFVFVSLEDETGVSNAIVTPDLFERVRLLITEEPFLIIEGTVQNSENVVLIKARRRSERWRTNNLSELIRMTFIEGPLIPRWCAKKRHVGKRPGITVLRSWVALSENHGLTLYASPSLLCPSCPMNVQVRGFSAVAYAAAIRCEKDQRPKKAEGWQ